MKQIVSNYSYSPTTNVVTLTGVNIDQDQLLLVVAPQVGRTMYNFASVTGTVSAGADTRVTLNASTAGLTTTSPLVIFYDDHTSTQTVAGTVTANGIQLQVEDALFGSDQLIGALNSGLLLTANVPIAGTVTIGNSVTIGSLPAISGTVTIGGIGGAVTIPVRLFAELESGPPSGQDTLLTCNGAGCLNVALPSAGGTNAIQYDGTNSYVNVRQVSTVTARLQDGSGNNLTSTSIGGLQRLNVSLASAATPGGSLPSFVNVYGGSDGSAVRTISVDSSGRQNINAQFPRVTLIDGSGTVTTANSAITVFASSSTRSYLLVQVTTGSAFVNVGATATTVNGINLTAGQGYSWETTIPQGIVSLISTTTNSRYVAKEA